MEQSTADLIELKKTAGVADIVVFGNGHHSDYGLPPSYNVTLGKHFQHLSDSGINCVSFELVADTIVSTSTIASSTEAS